MIYRYVKRAFDFTSSLFVMIVLALPMAVLALLIRIKLGAPVLFRQERMGMEEKPFTIYKFRTMMDIRSANGNLLPDRERLTKFGAFLRSTSLDELPELFCILRGNMSVIGPRPLPMGDLPYYTARERLRFTVRSGLIPPEILFGNTMPTWDEQLSWEADYAENLTFMMDIRIFFSVFRGLLTRKKEDYGEYARPSLPEERTTAGSETDT